MAVGTAEAANKGVQTPESGNAMVRLNERIQTNITLQPLLKNLNAEEKQALLARSSPVRFAKGQAIFEQGDTGEAMYLIESGQVKLARWDPSGKELILAVLGPGDFFGEMAVLDNAGRSTDATAYTDLSLAMISRSNFHALLLSRPEISLKIIATLCQRIRATDQHLQELAFGSAKERLKNLLAREDDSDKTISLTLTHQELATKIGTTRETVTRLLKSLREEGWTIRRTAIKK